MNFVGNFAPQTAWEAINGLIDADGSARHPMIAVLSAANVPARDLADAAHAFFALHARHPGVMDHVRRGYDGAAAAPWLDEMAEFFARERSFLLQLTVAAGPLPSTPGQAESQAAIAAQAHALDMLSHSDRAGCALGAAIALSQDWRTVRSILDIIAGRLGVEPPAMDLPTRTETATLVAAIAERPAIERALLFGAEQLLAQHRGLWTLLETRALARDDA